MENLKIEDLVEGEIYYTINPSGNKYIFKSRESKTSKYSNRLISDGNFNNNDYFGTGGIIERNLRKATPKEQHWLNCCTKENEFVPYEKAMETFNNKTFAIEVNSQEELNACMEYYKSLGYQEYGWSNTFNIAHPYLKIDTIDKTWQTVYKTSLTKCKIKTLKELGINQQNTQQYEVGRWYKLPNNMDRSSNVIIYIKFKNITDDGHQEYSHRIIKNKGYEENYGHVKTNIELLTDLSEIQQYLPESHPDKLVKQEPKQSKFNFKGVHCKTQEEWNFVISKYNPKKLESSSFNAYASNSFIIIEILNKSKDNTWLGCYGNVTNDKDTEYYSFNEWCNKFGHSPDFMNKKQEIPEYYQYIGKGSNNFTPNKIYKCVNPNNLEDACNFISDNGSEDGWCGENYKHFKPSTREAYDAQFLLSKRIQYEKVSNNYTSNYITGVDPYQNETIEIGDLVEIITNDEYDNQSLQPKGYRFTVNDFNNDGKYAREFVGKATGVKLSGLKLISKAKNNTTHVNKKVDEQLPKNIVQNTENWLNIKLEKPKQQIFSDNYGQGSFNEKLILTKTIKKQKSNLVL